MNIKSKLSFVLSLLFIANTAISQTDVDSLMSELTTEQAPKTQAVYTTFKSPRIIMAHSAEMLPEGVLDFRILHRFGVVSNGLKDMFGLDNASMRMSFDYGVTKHTTVGLGRSTFNKELDFFVKQRFLQQKQGEKAVPLTLAAVLGYTINTVPTSVSIPFKNRTALYAQLILARKFNEHFALQLTPTFLNRNILYAPKDEKTVIALGVGSRVKLTNRVHLLVDAFPTFSGVDENFFTTPLSVGFDIETGGHVFQLHFSNSTGMNENAFLTTTSNKWGKADVSFGFNLSRVFTIKKNTVSNF
jgi:hypothetical protein